MKLLILADAHWKSKIDKVLDKLSDSDYLQLFTEKDYGNGLSGLVVGLICQEPELNLKRRIRFDKKEKIIYMDIMLDLNLMKSSDSITRERIIFNKIASEVPEIINKYKIQEFSKDRFLTDFNEWITRLQEGNE